MEGEMRRKGEQNKFKTIVTKENENRENLAENSK